MNGGGAQPDFAAVVRAGEARCEACATDQAVEVADLVGGGVYAVAERQIFRTRVRVRGLQPVLARSKRQPNSPERLVVTVSRSPL